MSITAGTFSPSQLLEIMALANTVMADDVRKPDVTPYADFAKNILSLQTAKFSELQDKGKDRTIKVTWLQNCLLETEDYDDECELGGAEAGSDSKEYTIGEAFQVPFTISSNIMRTNIYSADEVVARQILEAVKAADEKIAQFAVSKVDDFAAEAVNVYTRGFNTSGGYTMIPAAAWTPDLMAYFIMTNIKNKLGNVGLHSGELMWTQSWKAMMEQANAEGKGAANKMNTLPTYFDVFNIDATVGVKALFMINPNSLALVSKSRFNSVPQEYNGKVGQTRYSIASPTLPGIEYDVIYQMDCRDNDIKHDFKIIARYDMFLNPLGCTAGRNGILGFKCTA